MWDLLVKIHPAHHLKKLTSTIESVSYALLLHVFRLRRHGLLLWITLKANSAKLPRHSPDYKAV